MDPRSFFSELRRRNIFRVAVAYAAWDFGGHPGYRDLNGLVLIDGGLLGSFDSADARQARTRLAARSVATPRARYHSSSNGRAGNTPVTHLRTLLTRHPAHAQSCGGTK